MVAAAAVDGRTSDHAWCMREPVGESQIVVEQSYRSDESAIGTDSDRRDAVLGSHVIIAQREQTLPRGEGANRQRGAGGGWGSASGSGSCSTLPDSMLHTLAFLSPLPETMKRPSLEKSSE